MNNIAIIPARSGSKGLKDKNIKELCGMPLLGYSIKAAQESALFSEIMVSTDSIRYAEIARELGANVPFLRSNENSGDTAGSWDVVKEVLKYYSEKGEFFDTVALLQPTSPLRTATNIKEGYCILEEKKADAITSVCETEHSPLWATVLPEDGSLKEFRKQLTNKVPRQMLSTYFRLNGAIYIRKIGYQCEMINLIEDKEYAYIMPRELSVDIDTEFDFFVAETILKYHKR